MVKVGVTFTGQTLITTVMTLATSEAGELGGSGNGILSDIDLADGPGDRHPLPARARCEGTGHRGSVHPAARVNPSPRR